ncbi:MAG: fibronectin type III domain-containing protein [Gammaproteobacteria bacterium]|nr:fibronectin type III domain-containing protein [Gammaproteobacteria bacterium]
MSGAETISALMIDRQFTLTCSGAGGTVNDTVNVTIVLNSNGTALLSWTPPTENTDGSALTDLAGYKIRYGTSPGSYSDTITINNPGLTSYLVENLASSDWYFAMTSFNSSGIESSYSVEVSKTVN